jgi:hypothetical protein
MIRLRAPGRGFAALCAVLCGVVIAMSGVVAAGANAAASTVTLLNFRLTGLTATTATFHWSVQTQPSTQWPIRFRLYRDGSIITTSVTSQITVSGLAPGQTNDYALDAVEPAGAVSARTPALRVTTRAPGAPPTGVADLRSTAVTPGSVALAWDRPVDDFDIEAFQVFDGSTLVLAVPGPSGLTSTKVRHLVPGTSHSFTVRTRRAIGTSGPSNAVTVNLPASDDRQAPTVPATVRVQDKDGCGLWRFTWNQSTDNADPQSAIEYEVFINNEPTASLIVQGIGIVFPYASEEPANTFTVRALDTSGNNSASVTVSAPFTRVC